nr:hypothetical protein Iba_scaffold77328CG0010 [Ipomoea batatas]GMD90984.1 hypothetical protein Iba_scaffold398402CG0010 [Ipomoea batatas]GME02221.1 hypothetical protein Iba_contig4159CG0010 [Ipomoea batatas]
MATPCFVQLRSICNNSPRTAIIVPVSHLDDTGSQLIMEDKCLIVVFYDSYRKLKKYSEQFSCHTLCYPHVVVSERGVAVILVASAQYAERDETIIFHAWLVYDKKGLICKSKMMRMITILIATTAEIIRVWLNRAGAYVKKFATTATL